MAGRFRRLWIDYQPTVLSLSTLNSSDIWNLTIREFKIPCCLSVMQKNRQSFAWPWSMGYPECYIHVHSSQQNYLSLVKSCSYHVNVEIILDFYFWFLLSPQVHRPKANIILYRTKPLCNAQNKNDEVRKRLSGVMERFFIYNGYQQEKQKMASQRVLFDQNLQSAYIMPPIPPIPPIPSNKDSKISNGLLKSCTWKFHHLQNISLHCFSGWIEI